MGRLGAAFVDEHGLLTLRQVSVDGNAARAGLLNGDVITEVDGVKAEPTSAFARPLLRRAAQSKAVFTVKRGDALKSIEVTYAPRPLERANDIDIAYESVKVSNGHERRTLITLPRDKKRHPAILFLAGSGCGSQEAPDGRDPVALILYELTRRGYVTMRVEKTGMGDSTGPPCYSEAGDMNQEVAGYRAGYAALSAHPSVNPKKIFIWGHSAGGTLAPLVAKDLNPAGVIAAGAMGSDFLRYMLAMRERERRLEGRSDADVAKLMEVTTGCLTKLLVEGQSPDDIEKNHPACRKQVRFDSPPSYIAQWNKIDLSAAWAQVKAPAMVVYGTGDFVTSEEESEALVTRINLNGNPKQARLVTLPMDHGFLAQETPERAWRAEQGIIPPAGVLGRFIDSMESFMAEVQRR